MGIADLFADLYSALTVTELHAEEPQEEPKEEEESNDTEGDKDEASEEDKEEGGEEGAEEGAEEEEEEEEEEDEPVDPKPQLEEQCAKSRECAPAKHHFDECVERVTKAEEDPDHKGPKEDCVEEFFHLQHCATQCAAPKLFKMLK